MKLSAALIIGIVALASPRVLESQARSFSPQKGGEKEIPASERPPAGMCRIWLEGVPAAQQPAPTDCASAVRNRPAKGRVVFGDDYAKSKGGDTSKPKVPIKGFAPPKKRP